MALDPMCIAEIRAAANNLLDEDGAQRLADAIETRAALIRARDGTAHGASIREAGREMSREAQVAAAIEKRARIENLQKKLAREAHYARATKAGVAIDDAVSSLNVGTNQTGFKRESASVDTQGKANEASLLGVFVADLRREGVLDSFVKSKGEAFRALEGDVAQELWEMRPDGRPGSTRNDAAHKIARAIHKLNETGRQMQNDAGAAIGSIEGYMARQGHDMRLLREAGFDQWYADIRPLLDRDRILRNAPPDGAAVDEAGLEKSLRRVLRGAYDGLASGEHYRNGGDDWQMGFKGPGNLAKRVSAERALHFTDAKAWLAYNRKYGSNNLFDSVLAGAHQAARNAAIMGVWGTNPRAAFDADLAWMRQQRRAEWGDADRLRSKRLQNEFAEVSGETNIPGNITGALWSAGARAAESMAKLGGAVISSITDIPVMAHGLSQNGKNLLQGYEAALGGLLAGRTSGETREIADLLAVGFEGMLGRVHSRFSAADQLPGKASKLMSLFFRLNGMAWWTDSLKTASGLTLSRNLAQMGGKAFADLPESLRGRLEAYGMDERKWAAINMAEQRQADGRAYVLADALDDVADSKLDGLLALERQALEQGWRADIEGMLGEAGKLDARGPEIAARFEQRLAAARERLMARLDQMEAGRGEAVAALDARLDLMRAEAERRWIQMHLDDTARAQDMTATLWRRLDEAEAAGRLSGVYRRRIMDTAREGGRNRVSAGRADGRRLADAERRVKDLEARVKAADKDLAARSSALHEDFEARWTDEQARAIEAIERVDERRTDMVDRILARTEAFEVAQARLRDKFRRDVKASLRAYFAEEVDHLVVTPGARERAWMRQGTQAGTVQGEILRFIGQFKAFPVAFTNRVLGREIYLRGDRRLMRGIASGGWGLAHIIIATSIFGYLAGAAKSIARGQTPRDPTDRRTWVAAFLQGGGLGIFGDFIFGEYARTGRSFVATQAGPVASVLDEVSALYTAARRGEDLGATAFRTAINHTPFINLFYTRMALDYMVLYQVQEMLNPGYLRRMEKRLRDNSGQTHLMPPSRTIGRGGGNRWFDGVRD